MADLIQFRRGTAAAWTAANPVLASGEPGHETDTGKVKVGNGTAAWSALPYFTPGAGGSSPDPVTWTKLVDTDTMATNTRWTVYAGTWTFGGTYGADQTNAALADAFLRLTAGVAMPPAEFRAIQATVRPGSGKVGVGFNTNAGWGTGALGICLDPAADQIWWDRFGTGGGTAPFVNNPATDYVLKVVEKTKASEYAVYVDGALITTISYPNNINTGGIGLYTRSGVASFRNVSVWSGTRPFNLPT